MNDRLAYQKIGFLKQQRFEELINTHKKTMTFRPQIN